MPAPNWKREFTHSIEPLSIEEKMALVAVFLQHGTGFAVVDSKLWVSDASMAVLEKLKDSTQ